MDWLAATSAAEEEEKKTFVIPPSNFALDRDLPPSLVEVRIETPNGLEINFGFGGGSPLLSSPLHFILISRNRSDTCCDPALPRLQSEIDADDDEAPD